ncbi:hypothetical protein M2323_002596 [Rhodoblastus acidophilus]|uniref:helix-turn-helix domain-containing protein n=1 Tax=Rhodoblastus acidophilus TaxID=1074 RepID=UPI0022255E72|nr:helix-turn-helix domain-containing protein [Rhodoblastus acidophilus]MCW2284709.1 hypothetical protein [Rhodoblastus acidophilus]MCW2333662.1 hypothetical protein [Rhodoblastus acidophilus]
MPEVLHTIEPEACAPDTFVSAQEIAAVTRLSVNTIRAHFPSVRIGRRWLFDRAKAEALLGYKLSLSGKGAQ